MRTNHLPLSTPPLKPQALRQSERGKRRARRSASQTRNPISTRAARRQFESKLAGLFAKELRRAVWPHIAHARRVKASAVGEVGLRLHKAGASWSSIALDFGLPLVTLWRWAKPKPLKNPSDGRFEVVRYPDTTRASKRRTEERHNTAGGPGDDGDA